MMLLKGLVYPETHSAETIMIQTSVGHTKLYLELLKIIGLSDIDTSDL